MGEIYRARYLKPGRDIALKILPDACASNSERLARLEREARTPASLNHPCIAQVYGFEQQGAAALAMIRPNGFRPLWSGRQGSISQRFVFALPADSAST